MEVEENYTNLVISKSGRGRFETFEEEDYVIVLIEKHQRKHVQLEKSRNQLEMSRKLIKKINLPSEHDVEMCFRLSIYLNLLVNAGKSMHTPRRTRTFAEWLKAAG